MKDEFKKNTSLSAKDFTTIEYLLRQGRKKLDLLKSPEIEDIWSSH
jgi:succinate dehydrogenase assembly factor 1